MSRPFGTLALAMLVLTACAEASWQWPWDKMAAGSAESQAPVPERKPESVPSQASAQQAMAAPAAEGEQAGPTLEGLVGLDFAAVRGVLGNPALEEIQPPATVWAYNGRGCTLSVYFFPNVDGGSFRALTYDVKGAEQSEGLAQRCFSELLQDAGKTGTN